MGRMMSSQTREMMSLCTRSIKEIHVTWTPNQDQDPKQNQDQGLENSKISSIQATLPPSGCAVKSLNTSTTLHVLIRGHINIELEIEKLSEKLNRCQERSTSIQGKIDKAEKENFMKPEAFEKMKLSWEESVSELDTLRIALNNFTKLKE